MRTPTIFSAISLLGFLLLAACTDPFSHGSGDNQEAVADAQSVKSVSYSAVAPLFQTYCIRCHAGFGTYAGLPSAAELFDVLFKSRTMPKAGSPQPSASELKLLQGWLAEGAPADGPSPAAQSPGPSDPGPIPNPIPAPGSAGPASYSQASAFFGTYCVTCHGGLSSYSVVKVSLADIQKMVFQTQMMPPSTKPQPSVAELAMLKSWIDAGALPDASVTPTPPPAPEGPALPATWSYISTNILNAKCIKCHSGTSKHGSFANYNDLFANGSGLIVRDQPDNSPLYQVLKDGATIMMPPLMTGVSVTPAERTAIHDWIANGAENDLLPQLPPTPTPAPAPTP